MSSTVGLNIIDSSKAKQNFRFLFDLPESARVLAVGRSLESWAGESSKTEFVETLPDADFFTKYKLILYHSSPAIGTENLKQDLHCLRKLLEAGGSVAIFGEIDRLRHRLKRWLFQNDQAPSSHSLQQLSKQLQSEIMNAGMWVESTYVTHHPLAISEEFIRHNSGSSDVENIRKDSVQGYIFCLSSQKQEEAQLLRQIESQVLKSHVTGIARLKLDRFILRQRGALLLFLSDPIDRKQYVSRIVSDDAVKHIIRRNHDFLMNLHNENQLSTNIKAYLPRSFGNVDFQNCSIFTESKLPGELAWLHCKGRFKGNIYQQSVEFLRELQQGTGKVVQLTGERLDELFLSDLTVLSAFESSSPELLKKVRKLVAKTTERLNGRMVMLSASHGDFGYGNILIHPDDGMLSGVIDWDTGRRDELSEIDHLNLLVQKYRIENNSGFFPAFRHVFKGLLESDEIRRLESHDKPDLALKISSEAALSTMLIRYMSRAANYSKVFSSEQTDYLKALNLLLPKGGL